MTNPLIELVEEYGVLRAQLSRHLHEGSMGSASFVANDCDKRLDELRTRLEALERIEAAARTYATRYVQDEADDPEVCVCPGQHEHAKELIEALSVIEPIRGFWHSNAAIAEASNAN